MPRKTPRPSNLRYVKCPPRIHALTKERLRRVSLAPARAAPVCAASCLASARVCDRKTALDVTLSPEVLLKITQTIRQEKLGEVGIPANLIAACLFNARLVVKSEAELPIGLSAYSSATLHESLHFLVRKEQRNITIPILCHWFGLRGVRRIHADK